MNIEQKFTCYYDHLIEIDLPDEYFSKGPLVIPCPTCKTRYEVTLNEDGGLNVKLYRHRGPPRYLAMHY